MGRAGSSSSRDGGEPDESAGLQHRRDRRHALPGIPEQQENYGDNAEAGLKLLHTHGNDTSLAKLFGSQVRRFPVLSNAALQRCG